jgi:hypothetical protein
LIGYDEPEILLSQLSRFCLICADAGHALVIFLLHAAPPSPTVIYFGSEPACNQAAETLNAHLSIGDPDRTHRIAICLRDAAIPRESGP